MDIGKPVRRHKDVPAPAGPDFVPTKWPEKVPDHAPVETPSKTPEKVPA